MFIDLDDFKAVNDTLGHAVGDELLRGVAARLMRSVRHDDVVARLGGDEFAVLVRRPSDVESRRRRARRAHAAVVRAAGHRRRASCSTSASASASPRASTRARNAEELLRDADVAMYDAKEAGKRRYAVFTPAMRDSIVRRHGLKAELERAIEQRELVVQYQPIVDLTTGKTVSVEALVRWNHPTRGRIPPLEFIPLAEDTGLIVPLGRYVLEEACARVGRAPPRAPGAGQPVGDRARAARPARDDHGRASSAPASLPAGSCSRSPRRCWSRTPSAAPRRCSSCATSACSSRSTTSAPATRRSATCATCRSTRLKIAREFVEGLAFSEHDAAFVRLIVGLAKTVGLKVVAEGIETREQLDMLREIGCDLGQGYYFAARWTPTRTGSRRPRRHTGLLAGKKHAGEGTRTPTPCGTGS